MPKAGRITVHHVDGRVEMVKPGHFRKRPRRSRYQDYLRSSHWRALRLKVLERDGHRCKGCRRKDRLEVHHLTYERLGRELSEDLITLCQRCHATEHQWMALRGRGLIRAA